MVLEKQLSQQQQSSPYPVAALLPALALLIINLPGSFFLPPKEKKTRQLSIDLFAILQESIGHSWVWKCTNVWCISSRFEDIYQRSSHPLILIIIHVCLTCLLSLFHCCQQTSLYSEQSKTQEAALVMLQSLVSRLSLQTAESRSPDQELCMFYISKAAPHLVVLLHTLASKKDQKEEERTEASSLVMQIIKILLQLFNAAPAEYRTYLTASLFPLFLCSSHRDVGSLFQHVNLSLSLSLFFCFYHFFLFFFFFSFLFFSFFSFFHFFFLSLFRGRDHGHDCCRSRRPAHRNHNRLGFFFFFFFHASLLLDTQPTNNSYFSLFLLCITYSN